MTLFESNDPTAGGTVMKLLVAFFVVTTACLLNTVPASADSAFCLRGCNFGYNDCSFATYQQCQASASGLTAWCEANPYFHRVSDAQPATHARYSRRRL
jgi:hypothetical protein